MGLCSDLRVVSGLRVTLAVAGTSFNNVWTPDAFMYPWIVDGADDVCLHKGVAWENWSTRKATMPASGNASSDCPKERVSLNSQLELRHVRPA